MNKNVKYVECNLHRMPRPVLLLCILLLVRQSLCRPSLSNQLNNEISSETKEIVVSASDEQQGRQPMLRLSPSHGVMCYFRPRLCKRSE
uniref:Secreted protein n=1 Tax=Acrobeloides nanus TaxID=290746 RepID=A0A914BXX3_9BILA